MDVVVATAGPALAAPECWLEDAARLPPTLWTPLVGCCPSAARGRPAGEQAVAAAAVRPLRRCGQAAAWRTLACPQTSAVPVEMALIPVCSCALACVVGRHGDYGCWAASGELDVMEMRNSMRQVGSPRAAALAPRRAASAHLASCSGAAHASATARPAAGSSQAPTSRRHVPCPTPPGHRLNPLWPALAGKPVPQHPRGAGPRGGGAVPRVCCGMGMHAGERQQWQQQPWDTGSAL